MLPQKYCRKLGDVQEKLEFTLKKATPTKKTLVAISNKTLKYDIKIISFPNNVLCNLFTVTQIFSPYLLL